MVVLRTSSVTFVRVPFAVSSMPNGMGKAVGIRTILQVAIGDRVLVTTVVMVMLLTVKVGPEHNHPRMISELVSTIQTNILAALMEVNSACRRQRS